MDKALTNEVSLIQDEGIRSFTQYVLDRAPNYFWTVPSSSTGKYHPRQSNGIGGLIRHVRSMVYFAGILCRAYSVEGKEKDIVISACILHDLLKYGDPMQKHTTKTHDKEGADYVFKLGVSYCTEVEQPVVTKQTVLDICKAIAYHMGQWTSDNRKKMFPEEYTRTELIVHLADMVSAGNQVNLDFLENKSYIG